MRVRNLLNISQKNPEQGLLSKTMQSKYLAKLTTNNSTLNYYSIKLLEKELSFCSDFPYSYKVLAENILRNSLSDEDIIEKINFLHAGLKGEDVFGEIDFYPSRVLMQDFTGVPALADLASMRESAKKRFRVVRKSMFSSMELALKIKVKINVR